jgi:hypothetical protein
MASPTWGSEARSQRNSQRSQRKIIATRGLGLPGA